MLLSRVHEYRNEHGAETAEKDEHQLDHTDWCPEQLRPFISSTFPLVFRPAERRKGSSGTRRNFWRIREQVQPCHSDLAIVCFQRSVISISFHWVCQDSASGDELIHLG